MRQARSSLAQTEAAIPQLEIGRRQASNRLCTLLGMPVADLAAEFAQATIPAAPPEVSIGLPADLLRRRPDIRQAERDVAAKSARIGVAEADLYPSLALNGFLGYAADDIERLFRSTSFTGFIIPQLNWNVLNYGRIANNIRLQDARLEGAALQYQQTVLNAGREVEDALVGYLQTQKRAAKLAESVRDADRSVELVLAQYRGGVADFNRVFNNQALLVSQQDQLAMAQGEIAQSLIRVYKALGGGWLYFCRGQGMPRLEAVETDVPPPTSPNSALARTTAAGYASSSDSTPELRLVAQPQTKGPATDRANLNHGAASRLYLKTFFCYHADAWAKKSPPHISSTSISIGLTSLSNVKWSY